MPNTISEVTRRKIFDYFRLNQIDWAGKRGELEFLATLYDLHKLPTSDYRINQYPTAYEDIQQHRMMNDDWGCGPYWVFTDTRFNLLRCDDDVFLKFLCEILHPTSWIDTRSKYPWDEPEKNGESQGAYALQVAMNTFLFIDGWEIFVDEYISSEPLFSYRKCSAKNIALERAKGMPEAIDSAYISKQISRLSDTVDQDPEAAIGAAKDFLETICKSIIAERGEAISPKADFGELHSAARSLLKLLPSRIDNSDRGNKAMNKFLQGIGGMLSGIIDLRNLYGSGHGKNSNSIGLDVKHAHLVVSVATALGRFMFECHRDDI